MFKIVVYDTDEDDKYFALEHYTFLADAPSTHYLHYVLSQVLKNKHVEVYNLAGERQCLPQKPLQTVL